MDLPPCSIEKMRAADEELKNRFCKGCPLCYWVGIVIREYRERFGLTQAELAERSDVSLPEVANIECNRKRPSIWCLRRICRAMFISVGQVLVEAESRAVAAKDDSILLFE